MQHCENNKPLFVKNRESREIPRIFHRFFSIFFLFFSLARNLRFICAHIISFYDLTKRAGGIKNPSLCDTFMEAISQKMCYPASSCSRNASFYNILVRPKHLDYYFRKAVYRTYFMSINPQMV